MNEERRRLIRELAEGARELEQEIRPNEDVSGYAWVTADWLAEELEALDWELAREALAEAAA
jgi:hypothetical protein